MLGGFIEVAVWRSERLHRSQSFGSVGENKNKASEHKQTLICDCQHNFFSLKK